MFLKKLVPDALGGLEQHKQLVLVLLQQALHVPPPAAEHVVRSAQLLAVQQHRGEGVETFTDEFDAL